MLTVIAKTKKKQEIICYETNLSKYKKYII